MDTTSVYIVKGFYYSDPKVSIWTYRGVFETGLLDQALNGLQFSHNYSTNVSFERLGLLKGMIHIKQLSFSEVRDCGSPLVTMLAHISASSIRIMNFNKQTINKVGN